MLTLQPLPISGKVTHRVYGLGPLANLEMEMAPVGSAGIAHLTNDLALFHSLVDLNEVLGIVGVDRTQVLFMLYDNKIPKTLDTVVAVDHLSLLGGTYRGSFGSGDIDTVMTLPVSEAEP